MSIRRRMRRVDEAIRQVLGDAVAGDLKDPRVGFVTVTDVRTSPICAMLACT
jgi:ribosome-binding factor A